MKTKNSNQQIETVQQDGGCCGTSVSEVKEVTEVSEVPCCEQPTDASACCDKNESKQTNIEKTGCC